MKLPVMPVPWKLVPAAFVDRPNRFLTHIRIGSEVHAAHLPDPGRLAELLLPDVELLVEHSPGPHRKTDYTVHLVRRPSGPSGWVCINTQLPNLFVETMLKDHQLPFVADWSFSAREVARDHSRFDFLLRRNSEELLLEVKSVTYAEDGIAQFPDAVTARGARHARHLAEISRAGHPAMVLFVIQRDDARLFRPMWERDPELGLALQEAAGAGVAIHAISMSVTPTSFTCRGEVPVDLTSPGN
ncbi:DNA/RNA nuclease SfsA [Candidatus Neomarinimicrobiota bacterium]